MKKLVNIVETEGEGFMALMGEVITVYCVNYFYTGKLIGVNDTCILLENPGIIFETGSYTDGSGWKDMQKLPTNALYIQTAAIEAFGVVK